MMDALKDRYIGLLTRLKYLYVDTLDQNPDCLDSEVLWRLDQAVLLMNLPRPPWIEVENHIERCNDLVDERIFNHVSEELKA